MKKQTQKPKKADTWNVPASKSEQIAHTRKIRRIDSGAYIRELSKLLESEGF